MKMSYFPSFHTISKACGVWNGFGEGLFKVEVDTPQD